MTTNISVKLKGDIFVSVTCDSFHPEGDFMYFTLDNFHVCSFYIPDIISFESFEFKSTDEGLLRFTDTLFDEGLVLKTL